MMHRHRAATYTNEEYRTTPPRLGRRAPELYLAMLGRFFSAGRFIFEQVSPVYAVHVVKSGQGVMTVAGRAYPVGPGDVFVFFPGQHLQYHDAPASPWQYTWFTLAGRAARRALASIGLTERQPHRAGGDWATRCEPVFREIAAAYTRPRIAPTFAVAAAWRLLDALAATDAPADPAAPVDLPAAARFLMEHRYMELLTVADLARQLRVSRSTLFRQFAAVYRVSPKSYLDSLRIAEAQRLLKCSRSSFKEIAATCGFASAHYFSRAFRRHCGVSPREWRRRQNR